jgi:hypothetical protein
MEEAQISLSRYHQPDVFCWRGITIGDFTVRSTYHMEKDRIERHKGVVSKSYETSNFWKLLWGMKVPNSIKMFLWRACKDILPTKANLQKRGMALDPLCIFCKIEIEMTYHILWECISLQDVWGACSTTIQKSLVNGNSFVDVMEYMMDKCMK